jgi:arylformamidase
MIDLSHQIEHGMVTYKGLPVPLICDYLSRPASREFYSPGTEFHIGRIDMVANTGTYVDSPFHRYADGIDLAELPLDRLAYLAGIVIHTPAQRIGCEPFAGFDLRGKAVLVHTGWDRHWRTPKYFEDHPYLSRGAAEALVEAGATFVGIDSHNIDDLSDLARPAHSILLGAGIPVCEHMCNLSALPDSGFRFTAVPVKVKGLGTFPVRAFALVE